MKARPNGMAVSPGPRVSSGACCESVMACVLPRRHTHVLGEGPHGLRSALRFIIGISPPLSRCSPQTDASALCNCLAGESKIGFPCRWSCVARLKIRGASRSTEQGQAPAPSRKTRREEAGQHGRIARRCASDRRAQCLRLCLRRRFLRLRFLHHARARPAIRPQTSLRVCSARHSPEEY